MCIDLSDDYAEKASKNSSISYIYAYDYYMDRCMTREYKTIESQWNTEISFKTFQQAVNFV